LPFPSQNGLGSTSATSFSDKAVEVEAEGGSVGAVSFAAGGALKFSTEGGGIFDFSFSTCEVAKKFGIAEPFVDGAADEVDVEDVGFSKLKGGKGAEVVLEVVPKIDID
jgi:hypothetical protein